MSLRQIGGTAKLLRSNGAGFPAKSRKAGLTGGKGFVLKKYWMKWENRTIMLI